MQAEKETPVQRSLRRAASARLKQAISWNRNLAHILVNIQDGAAPIQDMQRARQALASLTQAFHEASAYHSAHQTAMKGIEHDDGE